MILRLYNHIGLRCRKQKHSLDVNGIVHNRISRWDEIWNDWGIGCRTALETSEKLHLKFIKIEMKTPGALGAERLLKAVLLLINISQFGLRPL